MSLTLTMWADLIFISFRLLHAGGPPAHVPAVGRWPGRWPGHITCSDGPCRFLNIGDTDNICDILSP